MNTWVQSQHDGGNVCGNWLWKHVWTRPKFWKNAGVEDDFAGGNDSSGRFLTSPHNYTVSTFHRSPPATPHPPHPPPPHPQPHPHRRHHYFHRRRPRRSPPPPPPHHHHHHHQVQYIVLVFFSIALVMCVCIIYVQIYSIYTFTHAYTAYIFSARFSRWPIPGAFAALCRSLVGRLDQSCQRRRERIAQLGRSDLRSDGSDGSERRAAGCCDVIVVWELRRWRVGLSTVVFFWP